MSRKALAAGNYCFCVAQRFARRRLWVESQAVSKPNFIERSRLL
jgi:hypothetical protein